MKAVSILMTALVTASFVACSSNEHEVREIEDEVQTKQNIDNKKIGVNDDDEIVIQEESTISEELKIQELANSDLEQKLDHTHNELRRCRDDLADPRLGGSGERKPIPDIDGMKNPVEIREEIGAGSSDDKLKVVKREYFMDRLKAERKYNTTLTKLLATVKAHKRDCDGQWRTARVKAGLPAERYKAEGYLTEGGTWVETRKAEITLDDAFEIKQRQTVKKPD